MSTSKHTSTSYWTGVGCKMHTTLLYNPAVQPCCTTLLQDYCNRVVCKINSIKFNSQLTIKAFPLMYWPTV